jgi:hypothetical protein
MSVREHESMTHTFEVQIEPAMLRRAWNAWCFAGGRGWRLLVCFCAVLLSSKYLYHDGQLDTFSTVALTTIGVVILLYGVLYLAGLRRAQAKSHALIDGKATYTLSDATIEAESALGSIALAWSALADVRLHGDLVLLGFRGALYSPLPAAQVPPEALAFLIDHARAAGAKIRP